MTTSGVQTMNYDFLMRQAMQQWQAEDAKKPQLTIVSNETKTNQGDATMEETTEDKKAELQAILREAAAAPARPLHQHGAFLDLAAAVRLLALGADALKGIGVMMQPDSDAGNEQLNMARRGDASAIFEFFGEVLKEPVQIASEAAERLEWAAKGKEEV